VATPDNLGSKRDGSREEPAHHDADETPDSLLHEPTIPSTGESRRRALEFY